MVPWATLALVATNVAFFCWPVHPPSETCLSVQSVWGRGQWGRLLWAPFHHLGLCHLLLNMGTLFWLGWGLEQEVGSLRTGALLLALALLGGLMHLGLNALLALVTGSCWYWEHCAVGFSGVLFSLEAMGGQLETFPIATMATGITIPTWWLCILECLALALVYPRSSFTGHLSGILLGLTLSSTDLLSEVI
ncbi:putative Rhomboid domain-containing protein [Naja naja]|nr:putative Rhomboid domain-containing protein [Naja naja]